MMEYRKRRLPWILILLGAVMSIGSLVMLYLVPNVLQYTAVPPEPGENNETINAFVQSAQEICKTQGGSFKWMTLEGCRQNVIIETDRGQQTVNLVAVDKGWLEVYPRFLKRGRFISETEIEDGAFSIVLDEGLVFSMFGNDLPEPAVLTLNNTEYTVVGTVRHGGSVFGGRGVADGVPYDVYVPLSAAIANGITLDTMTLSATPPKGMGWGNSFLTVVQQWTEDGELIDLGKEVMRRTILPRIMLLIVGLYVMIGLYIRFTDLVVDRFEGYRQALKEHYFRELLPRLLGIVALTLAGYAVLVGLTWLLLSFSIQPLYVFSEWVPNNFVEWSSLTKVFWNLVAASSGIVRINTRELRIVAFWGAVLRWGVVLVLLGTALLPKAGLQRRKK